MRQDLKLICFALFGIIIELGVIAEILFTYEIAEAANRVGKGFYDAIAL